MATDKDRQLLFKNKGKDSEVTFLSSYKRASFAGNPLNFRLKNKIK